MVGAFVNKVLQDKERPWEVRIGDIGVQESDINGRHDDFGRERDHMILRKLWISLIYEKGDLTIDWR